MSLSPSPAAADTEVAAASADDSVAPEQAPSHPHSRDDAADGT